MPHTLSILHVGCGAMSTAWLKAAAAHPSLRIAGLVDLNPAAAEARRAEFSPQAYAGCDLDDALAVVKPDIVFNCTVPNAHHAITCHSLRAGAHVLSEKPLADSLEQAREIIELSREKNRLVAVTQNRRYIPGARTVKRILAEGGIGRLTTINCDFFIGAHFGGFREQMEHVLLLDMSIHHFDLARFFSGSRLEQVYCREWNPAGSWYRQDASAAALFNLTQDIVFNYRGSWCSEGCSTDWNGAWRFVGTEGSLLWNGADQITSGKVSNSTGFIRDYTTTQMKAEPAPGKDAGHESVIAEFTDCITSGTLPETNAEDNYYSLEMVFQAIESSISQLPIKA